MDLVKLKSELNKWMKLETWSSGHPLDEKRFHESLKRVFENLGTRIDCTDFHEVMDELVHELYPNWEESYKTELVNRYATKADSIANYLYDIK
ncbi:MAG: hypothetical protein ACSHW0_15895 [Thalassotalea sp.]